MKAFPVQLNSAYIYPIHEFDALKTWMNKVIYSRLCSHLDIHTDVD